MIRLIELLLTNQLLGVLVGGLLVHFFTRSRDREKWILDGKMKEAKELLDAISQEYTKLLHYH
jgi:hypothetical protein